MRKTREYLMHYKNTMKKLCQLAAFCGSSLFLIAWASPEPKSEGGDKVPQFTMSCITQVHESKSDSTADFAACSYNNNNDASATSQCMRDHGWSEKSMCPDDDWVHTDTAIQDCLTASKSENRVDHQLMNECLAKNGQREESQSTKLQKLLRGCQIFKAVGQELQCADKTD